MNDKTEEWIQEDFNHMRLGTIPNTEIETPWMWISSEGPAGMKHRFDHIGPPRSYHASLTAVFLQGTGSIRVRLKKGVEFLVHSGWSDDPDNEVMYRYFDANNKIVDTVYRTGERLTLTGYHANSGSTPGNIIWGVEVSLSKLAGNEPYVMDNFWGQQMTPRQRDSLDDFGEGRMSYSDWKMLR